VNFCDRRRFIAFDPESMPSCAYNNPLTGASFVVFTASFFMVTERQLSSAEVEH
jgi:hypothetical protein